MLDPRRDARFRHEALARLIRTSVGVPKHLDRYDPVESKVSRPIDVAHRPRSDACQLLVARVAERACRRVPRAVGLFRSLIGRRLEFQAGLCVLAAAVTVDQLLEMAEVGGVQARLLFEFLPEPLVERLAIFYVARDDRSGLSRDGYVLNRCDLCNEELLEPRRGVIHRPVSPPSFVSVREHTTHCFSLCWRRPIRRRRDIRFLCVRFPLGSR